MLIKISDTTLFEAFVLIRVSDITLSAYFFLSPDSLGCSRHHRSFIGSTYFVTICRQPVHIDVF